MVNVRFSCRMVHAIYSIALVLLLTAPHTATAIEQTPEHQHHLHKVASGTVRTRASYSIPAITMINQDGQRVNLSELLESGRPVMMNFIFTSCTAICPAMSATFASVQKKLGSDSSKVWMISVSIDPEYDTPDALKAYAKRFNAGPQWEFLTGSMDDSISVQKAFDADRGDKMNHAPITLLHTSRGNQWVRYEGFTNADRLAEEIRGML